MIRSIEIQGFRGIREGKLEDLTPLVVLVGPNGCGKSTILDALLIGASPSPGDAIVRVVSRRQGLHRGGRWLLWKAERTNGANIKVSLQDNLLRQCSLTFEPPASQVETKSTMVCSVTDLEISDDKSRRFLGRTLVQFTPTSNGSVGGDFIVLEGAPSISIVEDRSTPFQTPLHQLYTQTVEQGNKKEAKDILAEVVPGLTDIEILTEGDSPLVYLVFEDHAVPVALAGDGVQSLLRLSLELASHPDGVVLMEEPEVHQHPRAISRSARAIFAAVRRGIQVILSTHSLELIDYLLTEVSDDAELEKLSVFRLLLRDGCLTSHRISGPDVAFRRVEIEDDLR